ncbi:hypothetical protein Nepgr_002478 [Nepenthes gracilis]|uniref:Uncharacterized protein n=1 Tax=Nepenthes gracilis TaxID=150966 RepID=A0AAD3P9P4_NEPGR|nr:hypothetical protein Nepgr_002478 [Nepenthes gracilis]
MVLDVSSAKKNGNASKVARELLTCASDCKDNSFDMDALQNEHIAALNVTEDMEINITECMSSHEKELVKIEHEDATENSSSFGGTDSGTENAAVSSDAEVESRRQDDGTSMLALDGFDDLFRVRKKKLTTHWRNFIRPLMWRCKWVELKIRELESQALKYGRELAECSLRKQYELERFTSDNLHVKSAPTFCQGQRVNVMRRKKRKRVEEAVDIASYMAHHNLFSCYVNKKSFADYAYMDDECGNSVTPANKTTFTSDELGVNGGEWLPLDSKDGNSFEEILRLIEEAKLHLCRLRVRMDKMICENTGKFSLLDYSSLLAQCSAPNLESPNVNQGELLVGDLHTTPRHTSEKREGGQIIHESAVSSHGEVTPLPEMIEGSDQPPVEVSCKKVEGQILVYNRSIKQELQYLEDVRIEPVPPEKPLTPSKLQTGAAHGLSVPKPEPPDRTTLPNEQPTLKVRSISKLITPNNKRKRGRRRAESSRWSRKSSG